MSAALLLWLWVLLRPTAQPDQWGYTIIGVYETREACEAARTSLLTPYGTICATVGA